MSKRSQRTQEQAIVNQFREGCKHFGIPTHRLEDVWVPAFYSRKHRRAVIAAKKELAEALANKSSTAELREE